MKTLNLRQIISHAFFAVLGVVCKMTLAPSLNILTDAIFIPGGSVATGISIFFVLIGTLVTPSSLSATKISFLQGILALMLGMSSFQGVFVLISYTLPGIVTDILLKILNGKHIKLEYSVPFAGAVAIVTGALITNSAFFGLDILPFSIFIMLGIISGLLSGISALYFSRRLKAILKHIGTSSFQRGR